MQYWSTVEEMLADPRSESPSPDMAPRMVALAHEALDEERGGAEAAARETIVRARRHGSGGHGRRARINEQIQSLEMRIS